MYNVKIIRYPNGDIQLRKYSSPLVLREPNPFEKDMTFFYEPELDYDANPFTGKKTKEVDDFSILAKLREENARRSYNRTKQSIYTYSRCAIWEKFVTITFNDNYVDRYNFDECSKLLRTWLKNQRRNAPELQYLFVPELHKDGAIHFHGLLAKSGDIKFTDSGKRTKDKKKIYNISKWKYGFTTAIDVYDTHGVSKYLAKYITKDFCDLTSGKHRYFVSNNLQQPEGDMFLVSDTEFPEFLEMYVNSLGVEIKHISRPRVEYSFLDVDYYELL